ncbi:hypothetical protein CR513_28600, partial [Mucuna pruriens]
MGVIPANSRPQLSKPSVGNGRILDNMVDNYRTLKELATHDIMCQPWCEDPHKYLKEFHGNTHQFGVTRSAASKVVNEIFVVDNQRLENKITKLTSLVRQLAIGQHHTSPLARVCGICAFVKHRTNPFPTLRETKMNSAKVVTTMGGQQYRKPYDQYSNLRYGSYPMQNVPQNH